MGPERGRGRECNRNSASSGTGLQSGTESNRSAAPSRTEQAVDGSSNERRPRQHRELEPKFEVIITRENRSETGVGSGPVAPQIDQKSVYRTSRDASWRPRASQGRPGSVSEALQRILGAPGGSTSAPRGARQSARERPDTTKTGAKSHPGTKKSRSRCADRSRSTVASIFADFRRFSASP